MKIDWMDIVLDIIIAAAVVYAMLWVRANTDFGKKYLFGAA